MDLGEVAPAFLVVTHVRHARHYASCANAIRHRRPRYADLLGIGLHVHPALQRVHTDFERVKLALRVRRDERHEGVFVGQVTDPCGTGEPRA